MGTITKPFAMTAQNLIDISSCETPVVPHLAQVDYRAPPKHTEYSNGLLATPFSYNLHIDGITTNNIIICELKRPLIYFKEHLVQRLALAAGRKLFSAGKYLQKPSILSLSVITTAHICITHFSISI